MFTKYFSIAIMYSKLQSVIHRRENMICPNCKNEGADNAKFCTKCGVRFVNDVNLTIPKRMPVHNDSEQWFERYRLMEMQKESRKNKRWLVVLGAVLVIVIFMFMETQDYAERTQQKLDMYENRSVMDKTIDALDGWFELFN